VVEDKQSRGRVLDPVERLSEILFGLIMALTFTGSIEAASAARPEVRDLLVGAIGCNIAWGIVDAVMYVITATVARSRVMRALGGVRRAANEREAAAVLADVLPDEIVKRMAPRDFESLRGWVAKLPEARTHLMTARDLRGAIAVFLLVTISTFPVVVPFLFVHDAVPALRMSNAVALVMLFVIGWAFGKHAGMRRPLFPAVSMLAVGVVLAGVAIALGG
jgi:VIT1/CCC1 family predicted Fe2+/Mn2+ transporter